MSNFIDILLGRIDKVFAWARSSKTFSQNIFRGLIILVMLLLITLTLSVFGVVLLSFPRISTLILLACSIAFFCLYISTFVFKSVQPNIWRIMELSSGFLFIAFLSLFSSGFIFGLIPPATGHYIFAATRELPVGGADEMAVDSQGNIYLTIPFYQRIQVYNHEGCFLRGLHVNAHIGAFHIWLEDELLHVFVIRTSNLLVMNLKGQILENYKIQSSEERGSLVKDVSIDRFKDKAENVYRFHNSNWGSMVTKTDNLGGTAVLISNPVYYCLLQGPFPAWLFILCSMLMMGLLKLRKLKYKYLVDLQIKNEPSPKLE